MKYLKMYEEFYKKYLVLPLVLLCFCYLIHYVIIFDVREMILWGGLLLINVLNLYRKYNKK
jgi:hypothetical protein